MNEKINILLIEDNPGDANLINIYLKEAYSGGIALQTAEYLKKGLELLANTAFDVIIIDLNLPDSGGIDTFKSVYEAVPEKPIIVLTGLEDETLGTTTVKLGAQDFLIKGKINSKTLQRSINYSIERYKLLKSLAENAKMLEEKTADLMSEKQKLAQAQKLAHVGSWEYNIKDNIFSCSDEMYRILHVEPGQEPMTYKRFIDFIYPEDREGAVDEINRAIKRKRAFEFTNRIISRDGHTHFLLVKGEMLLDKDGEILKVIGTSQDVTQRKKEEQLEQLALVAIKSYNAVTIADREGRIEWVNEGFTRLFGYKLKDVRGTYGEILRKGEKTGLSPDNDHYQTLIREKRPLSYESKNYSKSGKEYWVLTSLTPLLNDNGEVEKIISIDSDITRRKRAEQELIIANKIAEHSIYKSNRALEELHKAKKEVEESLKVKEQFLANMSHEIRTPMNAIIGFTNLLLKSEQTHEGIQYLNAIKTSGQNLLVIINDILDFSKLERGKITIENIPFKLSQLVATVVDLMLPKAVEKNVKLSSSIDKNIPEMLLGDPTRLNQVLINLVGNAIKFTNQGSVKIAVAVINETPEDISLRFSIADTGIGIPPESVDKIFQGFTQASSDTTRKYGGTGLGLAISKELVELQGGEISVTSKLNEGSTFVFWLKFKKDSSLRDTREPGTVEKKVDEFRLDNVRVLLVEDNLFNQMLASKILENWHCKVEVAENGLVAVDKAAKMDFDVILMDIQLPEMDGYQATTHIRDKIQGPRSKVPIIAMTAHAFAEEIEKCKRIGMDDYISKPFEESKLYEKMTRALKSRNGQAHSNGKAAGLEAEIKKNLVDLTYLRKVSNSDPEFMAKMIGVFVEQTPTLLNAIKESAAKKDWTELKNILHRIKPSIAFMGISELGLDIGIMEKLIAEDQSPEPIMELYNKVEAICSAATEELQAEKKKLEEKIK